MTTEQSFFFQVLRDYLRGDPTEAPEGVDLKQVCDWALKHKLGGIFFAQCAPLLRREPALFTALNKEFGGAVSHSLSLQADTKELLGLLDRAEIPYSLVKGPLVAAHYPDPELRTMGDVDLLVRQQDAERIRDCLTPHGFVNTKWAESEWDYHRSSSIFELHSFLIRVRPEDETPWHRFFNAYLQYASPAQGSELSLDWNFHFLYLIAHISVHMRWAGIGFRQFYDLSVLMRRCPERFDWAWIRARAEEMDFFLFVKNCLSLCQQWFGVPSPYGTDSPSPELAASVTEKIFKDGVFGFQNEENKLDLVARARRNGPKFMPLAKAKALGHFLFPPYRELILSSKYSYLRGKPHLLPLAWVRRMAGAGNKKQRARTVGTVLSAESAALEQRSDQLRELGL